MVRSVPTMRYWAVRISQICLGDFQGVGGQGLAFLDGGSGGGLQDGALRHDGAGAEGAGALEGRAVGAAGAEVDELGWETEHGGGDFGQDGFVALAGGDGDLVEQDGAIGLEGDGALVGGGDASGGFDEEGKGDAAEAAAGVGFGAAGFEAGPVGLEEGGVEQRREVGAVERGRHRGGYDFIGEGGRFDEVTATQGDAVDAGLVGGLVDETLDGVGHVGASGATVGGDGDGVGDGEAVAAENGGDTVGSAGHEGGVQDVGHRAGGRRVGADVADPVVADGEEAAAFVEGEFAAHADGAAVIVAHEGLGTAGNPFDGTADAVSGQGEGRVFLVGGAADAEAAADIVGVDADAVGRQAGKGGHAVAHAGHTLAGTPEVEHVAVPGGQGGFGLHRVSDHAGAVHLEDDPVRSGGEGGFDGGVVAIVEVEAEIARDGIVQQGGAGREGGGAVGDRGGGRHSR